MRRLIINADDFGLTAGVNRAIMEGHKRGVVSSSTLMATGNAFGDAVSRSSSAPQLSVGCHIVLTDGTPVLESSRVPTLVEADATNRFHQSLQKFLANVLRGRVDGPQVEAEATAQISKLQAAGISVSHFDTHKHTHLFPQILRPLLRAAQACGVRAVRNPFGPVRFNMVAGRPTLWKRYGQIKALNALAGKFRAAIVKAGMKTPNGTLGIVGTGVLDERLFELILRDLPEGTWEFVCHPGYNDADLGKIQTRLRGSREAELRALTAPSAREVLEKNGVELISYHDFVLSKT